MQFGHTLLITNTKLKNQMSSAVLQLGLLLFGKEWCGLCRLLEWAFTEKLVIVKKLGFGKING